MCHWEAGPENSKPTFILFDFSIDFTNKITPIRVGEETSYPASESMIHDSSTSAPAGSQKEVNRRDKRIILDYNLMPPLAYARKEVGGSFLIVYRQDEYELDINTYRTPCFGRGTGVGGC